MGFLNAGKDAKSEIATQYLRTDVKGADAASLSHQLFVVLDARLPAKLAKLSDVPEGSRANPLKINEEIVGTVERAGGPLDIVVERVEQPKGPAIWLFSAATLKAVPDLYDEVSGGWGNTGVGQLLNSTRLRRARHFEWLAVLLCVPLFYFATVLLNKLLTPLVRGAVAARLPGVRLHPQGPARADPAAGRGAGAAVVPVQRVAVAVRAAGWGHRREPHPHRGPGVAADPAERRSRTATCADASPG